MALDKLETKRILWTIDPFDESLSGTRHVAAFLKAFARAGEVVVEPLYVLLPDEVDRIALLKDKSWFQSMEKAALKKLEAAVKKMGAKVPGLAPPRVLMASSGSRRAAVQTLNDHATKSGADLVVLNTHGRKGIQRLFVGSFAETLLLLSQVPVLTVNPHLAGYRAAGPVFFPTDFTNASQKLFEKAVIYASRSKRSIVLFHQIPLSGAEPMVDTGGLLIGGSYVPLRDIYEAEREKRKRQAEEWKGLAGAKGVKVQVVFEKAGKSTADVIVKQAKKNKASFVVMASEAGQVSALLIGSVARQVVRNADCPVWVHRA